MAIARFGGSTAVSSSAGTALSITLPASIPAKALIIVTALGSTTNTFTLPTGFTSLGDAITDASSTAPGGVGFDIWFKVAAGTEGGTSVATTASASAFWAMSAEVFTGTMTGTLADIFADHGSAIEQTSGGTDQDTTISTPTLTNDDPAAWGVFRFCYRSATTGGWTSYAGTGVTPSVTERSDVVGSGTTTVFLASADTNGTCAVGTGSVEGTSASTPTKAAWGAFIRANPTGELAATTPSVTSSVDGHQHTQGSATASLSPVTADFSGLGGAPEGPLDVTLAPVTSSADGDATGGPLALTLPSVTSSMDGDPTGGPEGALAPTLPPVTSSMSGDPTGGPQGPLAHTLPSVTSSLDAVGDAGGEISATLSPISSSAVGESRVFGRNVIVVEDERRALRVTQDETIPIYRKQIAGVTVFVPRFGAADSTLSPITAEIIAGVPVSGAASSCLAPVTASFASEVEDLMKFAQSIGNGSATSFTVTHNFGSRDVVVSVYHNTTFDVIYPDTVHATTNTVTVSFASAPTTDEYRVVVLYSSV